MDNTRTLERYNEISRSLASFYTELAKLRGASLQDWDDAYTHAVTEGMSYNPAAARAKSATRRWELEILKLTGEVDGLLTERQYLDRLLAYSDKG